MMEEVNSAMIHCKNFCQFIMYLQDNNNTIIIIKKKSISKEDPPIHHTLGSSLLVYRLP
jgi:hypothetical protein